MSRLQYYLLRYYLSLIKRTIRSDAQIVEIRKQIERFARRLPEPEGVSIREVTIADIQAEQIQPDGADFSRIILYLHGGGYCFCSPRTHRYLVSRIARSAGVTALLPAYRLAPEHPYPAARVDALAIYHCLLDNGIPAENIIVAGDCAGGGLALVTAITLRESLVQQPAALVCLSPWTDLTGSGDSYKTNAQTDPILSPNWMRLAWHYARDNDPTHPFISPLFAGMEGLPPILIHVGSEEILLSDSTQFADNARSAGVEVELTVWENMWHCFHMFSPWVEVADKAIQGIGEFIKHKLDHSR